MYKEKIFLLKKMSRKGKEEIDELSIGQIVELRMEIANVLKAHGLLPEKYLEDMDESLADKIMNQMTEQYFRKVFADKYCVCKKTTDDNRGKTLYYNPKEGFLSTRQMKNTSIFDVSLS